MRKHRFLSSLVIFVAGFALSAVIDGKRLVSLAQGTLSNPGAQEVTALFTHQPSPSQKWEYRVVTKYVLRNNKEDVEFELNRLGEQGYEVCGVAQSSPDVGAYLSIVLRRPK
jgi:hypothetical protein